MTTTYNSIKKSEGPWKVLLVEDDEATRESATLKLKKEAFEVVTAGDGDAALMCLENDPTFDAVLLDLQMPRKNGFEFLAKKNEKAEIKDIPVIVFSNLNQHEHVDQALQLGVKGYLVKAHHSIQQVVDELKECLKTGSCRIDN